MTKTCSLIIVVLILILVPQNSLARDYILGENDVLTITVHNHPDLSAKVRISGDGAITLPLIGAVRAADLNLSRLTEKIEELLADGFIVQPQVSIFIDEFSSRKITVLGEVKSPGLYEIRGHTSLLEIISKAGGLTDNAMDRAVIHRKQAANGQEQSIPIDLRQLMHEGQTQANIPVIDGDNIFIPKKEAFYVTGQVKSPGVYNYESELTVIQALTMAGGVNDKASTRRISIIRPANGGEQVLQRVHMDLIVEPNDVIVVPESFF